MCSAHVSGREHNEHSQSVTAQSERSRSSTLGHGKEPLNGAHGEPLSGETSCGPTRVRGPAAVCGTQ